MHKRSIVAWALFLATGSSCAFVSRQPLRVVDAPSIPHRGGNPVPPSLHFGQKPKTTGKTSSSSSFLIPTPPRALDKPSPLSVLEGEGLVDRLLRYAKGGPSEEVVLDWAKFKPTGSDKTWLGRAQGYANRIEAQLDQVSGWILSYSDLTPDHEGTRAGQGFLATNLAYTIAGFYLAQNGDPFLGLVTEVTAIASFAYHYYQLESRGVNNLPSVRLALLIDYICAFFSIGVALFYLVSTGGEQIMTVLPPSILALSTLGASWIWVKGRPYMILHGLWHFFSAYTGYLVGNLHAGAM